MHKVGCEVVERDGELYTIYEAQLLDLFAQCKVRTSEKERKEQELKEQQAAIAEKQRASKLKRKTEALSKPLQLAPEQKRERPRKSVEAAPGSSLVAAAAAAAEAADRGARPPRERPPRAGGEGAGPPTKSDAARVPTKASASVPKRPKRERNEEAEAEAASWDARDPAGVVALEDGLEFPWSSATAEEPLEMALPDFPNNDCLVLTVSVPPAADIWALNIVPKDHDDGATLLYHFNPRRRERGGTLVENDKFDDDWGRASKVRLPHRPALFALDKAELAFKLRASPQGVDVHVTVDRVQAAAWRLRGEVNVGDLALLVPTTDDFGNKEELTIHAAWWGKLGMLPSHRPPQPRR